METVGAVRSTLTVTVPDCTFPAWSVAVYGSGRLTVRGDDPVERRLGGRQVAEAEAREPGAVVIVGRFERDRRGRVDPARGVGFRGDRRGCRGGGRVDDDVADLRARLVPGVVGGFDGERLRAERRRVDLLAGGDGAGAGLRARSHRRPSRRSRP